MPFQKGNTIWKGKKRKPFTKSHRKNMSLAHIGKKLSKKSIEKLIKNHAHHWKNKKRPDISGEKSPFWKGSKIKYRGLHLWIETKRGKPHYCEHCKRDDLPHRSYNWANKSKKYKRDVSDWIRLCVKCHYKYDN